LSDFKANAPHSISAGAPPQTPLGSLQRSPRPPSWIKGGLFLREGRERVGKRGRGGREGILLSPPTFPPKSTPLYMPLPLSLALSILYLPFHCAFHVVYQQVLHLCWFRSLLHCAWCVEASQLALYNVSTLQKNVTFLFFQYLSQKLADFNNLWCMESWGSSQLVGYKFAPFT